VVKFCTQVGYTSSVSLRMGVVRVTWPIF